MKLFLIAFPMWTADANNSKLQAKTATGHSHNCGMPNRQFSHVAFFVVLKTARGASGASIRRVKSLFQDLLFK